MAGIQFKNIHKEYGSFEAIPDLNLEVEDGEFVILVGPSGCGKSTLLRMLAGLESITSGEIWIDDTLVNKIMPRDRDIAMVFQSYALYPHMTVAKNMGFSLKIENWAKADIEKRVLEAAEILGLEPLLNRKPSQLSGGQRQRVAMGRAIVRDPKVFLFDEPLSNLDAKLRVQMRSEIKALHERLKSTIVFVTHDQVEAMTMADRIVVMNQGRIEQTGSPLHLYQYPINKFVAAFLGSPEMNMIDGELAVQDGETVFTFGDGGRMVLPKAPAGVPLGETVTLGMRPEHLTIASSSTTGVDVKISALEPTGAGTFLIGMAGGNNITCELRTTELPTTGETVRLTPEFERIHFFDGKTGDRFGAE